MTTVERVARAICLEEHKLVYPDGPWREGELERKVDQYWRRHIPAARVAIEAMREPSDEMKRDGAWTLAHHANSKASVPTIAGEMFVSMIDAALSE